MKNLLVVPILALVCVGFLGSSDVWAGKFGGGKSFGRSFKTAPGFGAGKTRSPRPAAPFNKTEPGKAGLVNGAARDKGDKVNPNGSSFNKAAPESGGPSGATNALGAQSAPGKKGGFLAGAAGGMLGGLLAGSLLGSLLGGGAFSGVGLTDILLIALLAFGVVWLVRRRSALAGGGAQRQAASSMPWKQQAERSASDSLIPAAPAGSGAALLGGGAAGSGLGATMSDDPDADSVPFELPPGFDQEGFLDRAREHYRTLVAAWNRGDLQLISEYVSPELCRDLEQELARTGTGSDSKVLYVDASLVRACRRQGSYQVSLRFHGRLMDSVKKIEEEITDIWHLEQSESGGSWYLVGIEHAES
ncbi:MAG: Tim44-like domain-containing protein [Kistimonas sp.]|nr:Tim44-like domain-containing protein [Kistimonas sp.]